VREEFPVVSHRLEPGHAPRPVQMIACSKCGEQDFISAHNGRLPPQTTAAKFQRAGWSVRDVGKHLCPECFTSWRKGARRESGMTTKEARGAASDEAVRRAIPTLYVALEDRYDRENKAYKGGATDASIAAEVGLSVALVAERRERDFGPLVEGEGVRRKREAAAELMRAQAAMAAERDKFEAATKTAMAAERALIAAADRLIRASSEAADGSVIL